MYIVVRRSLKLSAGKVGGQCGHAVHYFMREFAVVKTREPAASAREHYPEEFAHFQHQVALATEWDATQDHTKVVLGATDEEFEQVKVENPKHFLVVDLGKTQVAPNTQTCLGLWPMRKSKRSPLLQVLKPL